MPKNYVLIGGAPTTGKSSIAKSLAARLSLPHISTDQLREIVKPYGNKAQFPHLYGTEGMTAEEFLQKYSASQIAEMEYAQGADVWPAVKGLLNNATDWHNGGVVEGVNILPHLVAEESYQNKEHTRPVFLVDFNVERMRHVVYTRGLYANASEYSDNVKEKEVEWAMLFAQKLKAEADKYNLPCVEVSKTDSDVENVLKALSLDI